MATSADLTSYESALKQFYVDMRVKNLVYKNQPLLALMPKMERFGGKNLPIPIIYGNPQGRSATFLTAQTNKFSSSIEDFVLTRKQDYSLANMDNETMEASMSEKGSFVRVATQEVNGALHTLSRSLGSGLYRTSFGNLGTISAFTATTVTLSNAADITGFEVGQTLVSAPDDASALNDSGAANQITAVDRNAGIITVSTTSWTALAATHALYTEGDRTDSVGNKISGLADWIPGATVPATPFFGVPDRNVDSGRLAGQYINGTSSTIEEALIDLGVRIGREGGRPDTVFMNHQHYGELMKELGAKVIRDKRDVPKAHVSFEGVLVHTPNGSVTVIPDMNCPVGKAYMLQMDTWKLYSLGAAPKILQSDGNRFLRLSQDDGVEVRCGYYAQVGCVAPGWNGVVDLAI